MQQPVPDASDEEGKTQTMPSRLCNTEQEGVGISCLTSAATSLCLEAEDFIALCRYLRLHRYTMLQSENYPALDNKMFKKQSGSSI